MRKIYWLWLGLALVAPPHRVLADNELVWEKQLPFKDAIIHYVISGMEEGTETLYVRNNGKERAIYRETVSNMMGTKTTNSTIIIKNPDFIYSYDLLKQQGFKAVNPHKYMLEEYNKLLPVEQEKVRESAKKMGAAYTERMGGTLQPSALDILGYSCDKVEMTDGFASFLIHDTDVSLKTEMNVMGMSLTIAANAVDKGDVDDKFFEHPPEIIADVNTQSDEIAKNMASQAIAILKDPESAQNLRVAAPKILPEQEELILPGGNEELMQ